MPELYTFMGIDKERFELMIKPFVIEISKPGLKVDAVLLSIPPNKRLNEMEKLYVAYEIGRMVGKGSPKRISRFKAILQIMGK
jgi:hypothetical protein